MNKRRIESEVAREMDVPVATLSAKLSPKRPQAKLAADELLPLFEAIRRIGYGSELRGVVYRFLRDLRGDEQEAVAEEKNLVPQILTLVKCLGMMSECANGIHSSTNVAELDKMRIMLRTEVLPVVLQMESILASRVETLRPPHKLPLPQRKPDLAPSVNRS
jgi:hypothetical protein